MAQEYKVPQNIDLEDKIVGPFTMRQFIYLLIGGGAVYGLFRYFGQFENGLPYFIILALPIALLTAAFTLLKVNDRPFEKFVLNFFQFFTMPRSRLWQRGYQPPQVVTKAPVKVPIGPKKEESAKTLDELTRQLNRAKVEPPKPAAREAPNSKSQAPNNIQIQNSNVQTKQGTAQPVDNVQPSAQPAPQKKGFLARLFGGKS